MSVVAQFVVPAGEFLPGDLLDVGDGVRIRLESQVPTGESVVPYLRVSSDHAEAVRTALDRAEVVEEATLLDASSSETLVRVEWTSEVNGLLEFVRETDAALLSGRGRDDGWLLRLRFPDRDDLSAFYRACVDCGLSVELGEVHTPFDSGDPHDFDLTAPQREVLLVALDRGYFDVPRGSNLTELADHLGISDTAASQRIRRGMQSLLRETLARRRPLDDAAADDEE